VVTCAIDDTLKVLAIERNDVLLLLSDSAAYMVNCGKLLKSLYPKMKHVTCLAHLMLNCAKRVRISFPAIDNLISSVKAATVRSRQRRNMFPLAPPAPVLTRWASWLEAALFYAEQYSEVKDIVLSFEDDGLIVSKAKSAISHADLQTELILVCEYRPLVELVLKMESQDFQKSQAYSTISRFQENLKSLDPAGILEYLTARLQNNPDHSEIIEGNGNLSPAEYSKLRKAQPSSGDVERSFSKLNHLLADDRNFLEDNIEQYIVCYANNMD